MTAALLPLFAWAVPTAEPGLAGGLLPSPGWLIGVLAAALVVAGAVAIGWGRRGRGRTRR